MHVWISFVCKRKVCICIRIFVRVFGLCAEACVYQSLFVTFMSVPVCVRMRACEEQKKPIQKEIDDKREPERITQRHSNSRRDGLCSVTIMLPPHPTHTPGPLSSLSYLKWLRVGWRPSTGARMARAESLRPVFMRLRCKEGMEKEGIRV